MTEPPDPVALAEADVRRLLPPQCGLQDPASLRTRLSALLETLHRQLLLAQSDARSAWASLDLERNLTRKNTHELVSRCADVEGENDQLQRMIQGHEKAYALLLAGMESSEEQRTALKLRVRELEAAR
jgi:hypothetical protein